MIQDLRFGVRMLLKHKMLTLVAVLSLALGIGANTAIFSLLDAVLLKLLPVERPEQLYLIQNVGVRSSFTSAPPYPCFEQFRARTQSFTGLNVDAGFRREGVLTMRVQTIGGAYQGERLTNFWKDVQARVERLPGVAAVSLSTHSPLDGDSTLGEKFALRVEAE
jgi:hypothetical protein